MDTTNLIPDNLTNPERQKSASEFSISDFTVLKEIGEGSFSVVYHAKEKEGRKRDVAIKMCFKKQIVRERRVEAVHREKNILATLSTKDHHHPFVMALMCTMQDSEHLYFVLSYASNGDLLKLMNKQPNKYFSEELSLFYAAELLEALAHIHSLRIVHRDVKPENVLVRNTGHVMLSDFGSAKDLSQAPIAKQPPPIPRDDDDELRPRMRRASFVGTAQYVSPEMLTGKEVDETADYWALGVCVYQFLTGKHCFHDESEYLMYKRIQKLLYRFPDNFPAEAMDLIENLLVIEPADRLGSTTRGGISSLKSHPYFSAVDWENICSNEPPSL